MKINQGESIFIDFFYSDGAIPNGYHSSYEIIRNDAVVANGDLEKNANGDGFELRIKSEYTEHLGVGEFKLLVSVFNSDNGYKDFIYKDGLSIDKFWFDGSV